MGGRHRRANKSRLVLPPLEPAGHRVLRSALHWLTPDGAMCRAGQPVAYVNLGVFSSEVTPFDGAIVDRQAVLATPVAGRFFHDDTLSRGGLYDVEHFRNAWETEQGIGSLEGTGTGDAPVPARLMLVSGRRVFSGARVETGLLNGWFDRLQGWWDATSSAASLSTVLFLGSCEFQAYIRGDQLGFLELFEQTAGPAHVVYRPADYFMQSALTLTEHLARDEATAREARTVIVDLFRRVHDIASERARFDRTYSNDVFTVAAFLQQVNDPSPLLDTYEVIAAGQRTRVGPANAVVLSLPSEAHALIRHKRSGFFLPILAYRLQELGPALRQLLLEEFEPLEMTADAVAEAYVSLIDSIREHTNAAVIVLNSAYRTLLGQVYDYSLVEPPVGDHPTARHLDFNLALASAARQRDIRVVDVHRLVRRVGDRHLPDGIHPDAVLQREVRGAIVEALRDAGLEGWRAHTTS